MKVKLGSYVQVDWEDASSATGVFVASRDHKPIVMHTRGWVVAVSRKGISVASERYTEEEGDVYRTWTFILACMVVKITKVANTKM